MRPLPGVVYQLRLYRLSIARKIEKTNLPIPAQAILQIPIFQYSLSKPSSIQMPIATPTATVRIAVIAFRNILKEVCGIAANGLFVPRPPGGRWESSGAVLGEKFSVAWRLVDAQKCEASHF